MILTVGAFDSSGGAGLDQDRRTAEALGESVRSALTGVTAQGREGVLAVRPAEEEMLLLQLETHWREDPPSAVKVGALCDPGQIGLLAGVFSAWKRERPRVVFVVDPVFAPTRGRPFLEETALSDYGALLDCADVLTPNREELERLSGFPGSSPGACIESARELARRHNLTVALTGGHFPGPFLEEYLIGREGTGRFVKGRKALARTHGTGCCFATALALYLGRGLPPDRAFRRATATVGRLMGRRFRDSPPPFQRRSIGL